MRTLQRLSRPEMDALQRFRVSVRELFADAIEEIRLYGSRARAEGSETSDLDVAVITKPGTADLRREIYDIAADIMLSDDIDISPLVWTRDKYDWLCSIERRIALDIRREGISL